MKKIWEAEMFSQAATLYVWSDEVRTHPVGFVEATPEKSFAAYKVVGKPQDAGRGLELIGQFTTMEAAKETVEQVVGVS